MKQGVTMSDNDNTQDNSTVEDTKQHNDQKGSCCKPHASLYISVIALILAVYAVFNVNNSPDNSAITAHMTSIDERVTNINNQLESLSSEMQSNRDNLVQNKLKKALESVRDISNIAEEGKKSAISEVEKILQTLTDIGDDLSLPSFDSTETPNNTQKQTKSTVTTEPETPVTTKPETIQEQPTEAEHTLAAPTTATPAPETAIDSPVQPKTQTDPEPHLAAPQAF